MSTHHVIIGGGPAATNAAETIREFDGGAAKITLVSDEPAHSRMALPYWLAGKVPREHVMTADDARQKLEAGATLVQIYTGLIYGGPGLVRRIAAS